MLFAILILLIYSKQYFYNISIFYKKSCTTAFGCDRTRDLQNYVRSMYRSWRLRVEVLIFIIYTGRFDFRRVIKIIEVDDVEKVIIPIVFRC